LDNLLAKLEEGKRDIRAEAFCRYRRAVLEMKMDKLVVRCKMKEKETAR